MIVIGLPQASHAQGPTPTPDPALTELQQTIVGLDDRFQDFERDLALSNRELQLNVGQQALTYLAGATIIGTTAGLVVGFLGGWIAIRERFQSQLEKRIEKEIYRVDPNKLPIHIPDTNFDKEGAHLRLLGFNDLRSYSQLSDAQTNGIVIYYAKDENVVTELIEFIKTKQADPKKVAYLVYAPFSINRAKLNELYEVFVNSVPAQHPVTIASQIYALARGIAREG
jgi:hypothetical protein